MYELFTLIDGGGEGVTADDDSRIYKAEWLAAVPALQAAAASWAPFAALAALKADGSDFAAIDANGGGFILLTELCEWIENGERRAPRALERARRRVCRLPCSHRRDARLDAAQ